MAEHRHGAVPRSTTPALVWIDIVILLVLILALLSWLVGNGTVVAILFFVALAVITPFVVLNNPLYHARVIVDPFRHTARVVFKKGYSAKSPLENLGDLVNLQVPVDTPLDETFSTKGPDRIVKLVFSIWPDATGTDAEENIITFGSFGPGDVVDDGKATFRGLLADYFEKSSDPDKSLERDTVFNEVFNSDKGKAAISDFKREHGAQLKLRLEDIKRTSAEQELLNELAGIKNVNAAITELVNNGWQREAAEKYIKLRTLPNTNEVNWNIGAPPTLTHFSVVGGVAPTPPSRKKGDRK